MKNIDFYSNKTRFKFLKKKTIFRKEYYQELIISYCFEETIIKRKCV